MKGLSTFKKEMWKLALSYGPPGIKGGYDFYIC